MQPTAVPFFTLDNAIGSIQPDDSQSERLDEFTERVGSGEFLRPTDATVVSDCIDGRCGAVGTLLPNAAGGTESLMVADDLTSKLFAGDDSSTLAQYHKLLDFLQDNSCPIGGHTADGASGHSSGCGANDKLSAIYEFIATHGDVLRELALNLGVDADDETHSLIVKNAAERSSFSEGDELLEELRCHQQAKLSVLKGNHREVVAIINTRSGTTLDRDAVRDAFGDDYQAFNVDVWAFPGSAAKLASDQTDKARKVVAMVYYNLATAHVLVGPALRVVVVK